MSNLKSLALTVLELLAFNAQKIKSTRDPGHAPIFEKILRCRVWTVPGNTLVKFESVPLTVLELLASNARFKLV